MRRYFSKGSNVIGPKDINKNGQIESWKKLEPKEWLKVWEKNM
jgi:hypothetical protein